MNKIHNSRENINKTHKSLDIFTKMYTFYTKNKKTLAIYDKFSIL